MKIISVIFILSLFSINCLADNEFALLAGPRSNSAETNLRNASIKSQTSYQFGALVALEFYPQWYLRTGMMLVGRQAKLGPTLQGDIELNFTYVDIPMTGLFRFSEMAGVFAGPVFAFNQSKETNCSLSPNCSAQDVKSLLFPWQLGISFRFASQLGAELYYEYAAGDLAANFSDMKSVGANFLFYFE